MWREREEVLDLAYIIIKVIDDEEVGDEGYGYVMKIQEEKKITNNF